MSYSKLLRCWRLNGKVRAAIIHPMKAVGAFRKVWLFKLTRLLGNIRGFIKFMKPHGRPFISNRGNLVRKILRMGQILLLFLNGMYWSSVSWLFAQRKTKPLPFGWRKWNSWFMRRHHERRWRKRKVAQDKPLHISSLMWFMDMCTGKVEPWMGSDEVKVREWTWILWSWIWIY